MNKVWTLIIIFNCFASTVKAEVLKIPLHKLAPVESVDLKCVAAEYSLTVAIPERWKVEKAIMNFSYMNSSGLLAGKSRLVIKLNGFPLKQVSLNPDVTEGKVELSLPVLLLEPGYNNVSFHVSQHYSLECENPCAEDLWTTLKLNEGAIQIEYTLKPVPLKLSTITNFLFDPKALPQGKVHIVTKDLSSEIATLASIVASGIARRFDYKKVTFTISQEIKPGQDNILVGSEVFVKEFLEQKNIKIKKIIGPFLKIMSLPVQKEGPAKNIENDPFHALIMVSGLDLDHVKLAAETMAIMSLPYPDTDELVAIEFTVPDISLYGGRLVLSSDKKYSFKTLNFGSPTFKGINPSPKDITFRLPADFLIKQNQYAKLNLHYSYGAAMRSDSVLNILLNNKHISAIHLDSSKGALIEGYNITLPTHLFQAGTNIIRFVPVLSPSVSKNCEFIQTKNLFLTIFGNSSLYFPPMPHFVKLPKIELFFLNGFPFTRWPDGHEAVIYITKPDPDTIAAALNLVGLMTQKNGYPLLGLKISLEKPLNWDQEIIVIGEISTIPEDLKKVTPLKLTRQSLVPYPVVRSWKGEVALAFSKQISGIGSVRGYMMEFQSPYKEGRTILLLTALSTKKLLLFSEVLLEPAIQARSKGDVVMVDLTPPTYQVTALDIGKKFFTGKSGKVSKLDFYLQTYPYLYQTLLGLLVLLLALSSFYFLQRRSRKRRVQDAETVDDEDS